MSKVKKMSREQGLNVGIDGYPSFHKSGSVLGMKQKFYGQAALLIRCGDYIYNVPAHVYVQAQGSAVISYDAHKNVLCHMIKNIESLPRGTGAKYLLTVKGHKPGELIAEAWKNKKPGLSQNEVLIEF